MDGFASTWPGLRAVLICIGVAIHGLIALPHERVRASFEPWMEITGTGQGLSLFASPDTVPHRLVVEGKGAGDWQVLYQDLDPDHALLAELLSYRRLQGVYDPSSERPGRTWQNFSALVARRVFLVRPDLDFVRIKVAKHTRTYTRKKVGL